jgi:hypothetical protein
MEGKEVRFGDTSSALFNVASTQTSTGSVNSSADSFTPMGGFGMLTGMMLGEVSPGGDGSGLYTILLFAVIAVFIGGLMIGRTPEYLGKKIQAREVKLAGLGVLVMPIAVLVLTGLAVSLHAGRAGPTNVGPHGFTEILYAITSQGNNNGSAFAGLNGNTAFYNVIGGIDNGWRVAMTTLGNERGGRASIAHLSYERELWDLVDAARSNGRSTDPLVRQDLAWAYTQVQLMRFSGLRLLAMLAAHSEPGSEASVAKLFWSEYHRRFGELALDVLGTGALGGETITSGSSLGRWYEVFLLSRAGTIYSGTSEIQRNIVAERALGLPKEPRG